MSIVIVNFLISLLFAFSTLYFIVIAIEEIGVLKHYLYESKIKNKWGLFLLGANSICQIIIYFIIAILIMWVHFNYDVYLSVSGGSLIDMV